ncbi:N/A [soil metagenome]
MNGRRIAIFMMASLLGAFCEAQTLSEHNPEYHLQYSDSLNVKYQYTPELDQIVVIGPDGRATISGIGTLVGRGLTLTEFQNKLTILSEARLVKPVLSVSLKDYVKPQVYVEGEVNTPGRVELRSDISVLDAIALAGGFKDSGAKSNVLLLRSDASNGAQTRVVNLTRFLQSHHLEEVPQLRSGDVIYVSATKFSTLQKLVHLGAFGAIYNPVH